MKKLITVLFLVSSFVFGQVGSVIITEILYNANSSETTTQTQFIEIVNTTGSAIDLSNWKIDDEDSDGPNTITSGTIIPAYGIVVICGGTESDFRAAWGSAIDASALVVSVEGNGETMINLSNSPSSSSEIVQLLDESSTVIDEVNYDDSSPWPADNNASSIYLNLVPSSMNSTNNDDGSNWSNSTSGVDGAIQNTSTTGIGGLWNGSDFGSPGNVQGQSALPVELTTFTAAIIDQNVELNWETATEVNNYGFEIERASTSSAAGKSWETLGFVEGHGNSNSPKFYSYTDNTIEASGKYNYRLKQIDIDGTFEYSDVVEANLGAPESYELDQNYPNPFNPTTSIRFNLPMDSNVKLTVFNVLGQEVAELINENITAGYHSVNFDGSSLNSGIYFYQLETNDFTQIRKMMLVK